MCACQQKAQVARIWGDCGIPKKRLSCSFEAFDAFSAEQRNGKELARELAGMMANQQLLHYEGVQKNSLCFSGLTGRAKSSLMACIALAWIKAGAGVLWVDYTEYLEKIRGTYEDGATTSATAVIESAQRVPLLCFDDLGDMKLAGEVTDHTREKTYSLIRYRYENELPTVITTNLTAKQLYKQFGHRIADRIGEMCHWVDVAGDNLRFGE